ncbi:MAG: GGDEF domain-containing protein [Verrucomicrobiota bacterium]
MIAVLPGMLTGALSVVVAVVVSFVAITLIASYYRFQHIVQQAEDTHPKDMDVPTPDILRVQLARYLTGCSQRGTSFTLSLIQANDPSLEIRMDSPFVEAIKKAVRHDDIVCVYDAQTVALVAEAEPNDSESVFARIAGKVAGICPGVSSELLRAGIAAYPGHGLRGNELLDVAKEALEKTDMDRPAFMPEIVDVDEEEETQESSMEGEEESSIEGEDESIDAPAEKSPGGWAERRKSGMLDELTGVLKPSAVSAYMQRMMNDLRHKKKKAALFCVGVNNIDHITRFHGEEAADDVIAGVSKILQDNVRATDLIGRHEKHAFLVLAQVSLENAETIGKRISTLIQQSEIVSGKKKLKTTITLGVAAYPEHGRNLHALYRAGQKVLDYNRGNDIRAYAIYDPQIHDGMPSKPIKSIKAMKA